MYTIKNYCMVSSLEEAYELKKKNRNNTIIGGNLWLKMGNRNIINAIDLSLLGLDQIEEEENGFRIGCMVNLRQLELDRNLNDKFCGIFSEAMRHIVGVQFRNCATVGGSIFPRFGFSDVLTAFLACDSSVELFHGGTVPLKEFIDMPLDQDILTHIYVPKDQSKMAYQSFRITETDFPVLTCAVVRKEEACSVVIGARPACARLVEGVPLSDPKSDKCRKTFAREVIGRLEYGSNMRGSAGYRRELSEILIGRCLDRITEDELC